MIADKIFQKKPPVQECIRIHKRLNETLELMKKQIRGEVILRHAADILISKWGSIDDYGLYIKVALQESFGCSHEEAWDAILKLDGNW